MGIAVAPGPGVLDGAGGVVRVGDAEGDGVGEVWAGGVVTSLAGGGASGGAGVVGVSERPRGSAISRAAATAQVTPTPAAVRTSRRRDALRRSVS
ncbi:hypothetical protein [Streptomyces lanatus]|uniref:Uncharacterized protein n=1 Tax=Streptomyces lanatus TaxID=66900 RepID=A0ABV1XRM8_9ACTN|nr:hypothetical protein [Streptomyces lanatus]